MRSEAVGIAVFDEKLRFVRVNERLARINRRGVAEHLGRTVEELLGPGGAAHILPHLKRALAGEPVLRQVIDAAHVQLVMDALPVKEGVAVLVSETTELREAEQALAARLEHTELLSELSATFIELPAVQIDRGIQDALAILGRTLQVDRASLWRFEPRDLSVVATHEWAAEESERRIPGRPFNILQSGYFGSRILEGETVTVESRDALPPEAALLREALETLKIKAMVAVPLLVTGELRGILAFSRVDAPHTWAKDLISTVRLASHLVANALERQACDRELRERVAIEHSFNQLSTRLSQVTRDSASRVLGEALPKIGESLGFSRVAIALLESAIEPPHQREWRSATLGQRSAKDAPIGEGWPLAQLIEGEIIMVSNGELPGSVAANLLETSELDFHVVAPLRAAALRTIGVLVLERRGEPPSGRIALTQWVRVLAEMLTVTLVRVQAEAERQRTLEELERVKTSIEVERDFLRQEIRGEPGRRDLIGASLALQRALEAVDAVASTNATTLLIGESGVGKELFARAVHERSLRAGGPLIKVNCATIPKDLFESEFFGHVRGSFTGALKTRTGRFELANSGTLFLDEVGEIPLDLQSKLLRVLQEGEFERVGDDHTRRVDVRIVAATNRNLARDVATRAFRQDLYYRLAVFPIHIPPLRERRSDIPLLAQHFLALSRRSLGLPDLELTDAQLTALADYDWPGNVRELEHVIERAAILARHTGRLEIELELHKPASDFSSEASFNLREISRRSVLAALEQSSWRIGGPGGAAELLGLRPSTLRDRMRALKIERPH